MKLLERTPIGRWPLLLGVVVLFLSACEGTVTAPTPQAIQSAIMKDLNQLTVSSCAPDVPQDFFSCSFSGVAQNIGAGCATNLHGVSKSFGPDRSVQLGEASWSFNSVVQPGEQIVYKGCCLIAPQTNWFYVTSFVFDTASCR